MKKPYRSAKGRPVDWDALAQGDVAVSEATREIQRFVPPTEESDSHSEVSGFKPAPMTETTGEKKKSKPAPVSKPILKKEEAPEVKEEDFPKDD